MNKAINWIGNAAGILGVLMCIGTVVMRLGGTYVIAGFGVESGFEVGVGLMVFACLAKLQVQTAAA
jgi:hypothetical protein